MDRLPRLRVSPGGEKAGKGSQGMTLPGTAPNPAQGGRGWRNLPWSTPGTCWSIHSIPCRPCEFPGRARTEEFRACDKHPFNPRAVPRIKNCRENAGSSPAGAMESIPAGNTNRQQGMHLPSMPSAAPQGWAGGTFGAFPVPEGQREWPGWALIPPERGARCHGERLGWRRRLLSPSPA